MMRLDRNVRRRRGQILACSILVAVLSCGCLDKISPWKSVPLLPMAQAAQQAAATQGASWTTSTGSTNPGSSNKPKTETSTSKASAAASASSDKLALSVVDLTSANFGSTVNDGNVYLIEFYTTWCSHCQNFKSSYANIATTFHSSPKEKIRVARVECGAEKALATRFGVQGFPSFYLVDGYNVYEFDGTRSESHLISFARGGYKQQDVSGSMAVQSANAFVRM